MNGLAINSVHLIGTALGFAFILWMARSEPLSRWLWITTLAVSAVMAAFVFWKCQSLGFFGDFRKAYWPAGRAAVAGRDGLRPLLENGVYGFVNLPIVALLFTPITIFPERVSAALFSLVGVVAVVASGIIAARLYDFDRQRSALALLACAVYGPLVYSIKEGNTSHVLLILLFAGMALVRERRDLTAGALFGLAGVVKPPLLLIGVYFFLRGRWAVVLGGIAVCAVAGALSIAIYGLDLNALWLEQLRAYGGAPVRAFNNQSIGAMLGRFETGTAGLRDWQPYSLSPLARGLTLATAGLMAATALAAALVRDRTSKLSAAAIENELVLTITFICAVSSISWSHYYAWLLPAFAFAWSDLRLRKGASATTARIALAIAFILAAPADFLGSQLERGAYGPLTGLLSSYRLLGALVLFGVLVWIRWKGPQLVASPIGWRVPRFDRLQQASSLAHEGRA